MRLIIPFLAVCYKKAQAGGKPNSVGGSHLSRSLITQRFQRTTKTCSCTQVGI